MTDVMSQDEINKLLNAISTGEKDDDPICLGFNDSRKIRLYDFHRPRKFKKSVARKIGIAFESFANDFADLVEEKYGVPFRINLASFDELTYEEYLRCVLQNSNFLSADLVSENFSLPVIFEFEPKFTARFLNKAFGFESSEKEDAAFDKEQKKAAKKFIKKAYKVVRKTLSQINVECSFENFNFETKAESLRICDYSENVLFLTFNADFKSKKKSEDGMINFCIPYNRGFLAQVESLPEIPDGKKIDTSKVKIPVYQTPKKIQLSVGEIRNLKVGDTVNFKTNEFIYIGEKNEN